MTRIAALRAREVLDSRGDPTVEVEAYTTSGPPGRAIVPSGASTAQAEACELRDADPQRYDGRGVRRAVANVLGEIAPRLVGLDPFDQAAIDRLLIDLDGSPQKSRLGANAVLGASLAVAHAAAAAAHVSLFRHLGELATAAGVTAPGGAPLRPALPLPMTNMISGGLHAGGNLDFQDVLAVPVGAPDFPTALEWLVRVYRRLGEALARDGINSRLVGDEGGYGPPLANNREAILRVLEAITAAGLRPTVDITLALDIAATHLYDGQSYHLRHGEPTATGNLNSQQMIALVLQLIQEFPLSSVEDPLAETDVDAWPILVRQVSDKVRIVGDDLLATNPQRIRQALASKAATAALVKPNQVGTLTETFEAIRVARAGGMTIIVSARSGETEDTTIADLAVATGAEQIKIGSVTRSERLAKYNRLLRIYEEL
ncbi:MAG: phosphopyruvate hydratase [Pirellulales bacterium]